MRRIVRAVFGALLVLMVACDPGMTIRQADSPSNEEEVAKGPPVIHVKTDHPLIGETWYAPEIKVTNTSGSSIFITRVELAARGKTYENHPHRPETFPLTIQPGSTDALDVWFQLEENVRKLFQQSAELRVHYRSSSSEGIAHATIVGGPLDGRTP